MLYSVDVSERALLESLQAIPKLVSYVRFVQSDSVSFLASFNKPIDLLYLDSYDFVESDPLPSQQHHLNEIMAAYPFLHENSIVMIDDCDLPHGGKGALAIEYLLMRGWKIYAKHYQVILVL